VPTIPSHLGNHGYATATVGKMHLLGSRQMAGFQHRGCKFKSQNLKGYGFEQDDDTYGRAGFVTHAEETVAGVQVVEGFELLGPGDADGFSTDGLHPSELGFQRIAKRLLPVIQQHLSNVIR
jgi:arylsulfatase A-like enzyme